MVKGLWRYGKLLGYTSCGLGASAVFTRFNCSGEISYITFRKSRNKSDVKRV
jgi:predicted MPP superfamily phosphohydrolase